MPPRFYKTKKMKTRELIELLQNADPYGYREVKVASRDGQKTITVPISDVVTTGPSEAEPVRITIEAHLV